MLFESMSEEKETGLVRKNKLFTAVSVKAATDLKQSSEAGLTFQGCLEVGHVVVDFIATLIF